MSIIGTIIPIFKKQNYQFVLIVGLVLLSMVSSGVAVKSYEYLGEPCRAKNILASVKIIDPVDNKEYLVLSNTNEATNMELILINLETHTGKVYLAPAGQGSWTLLPVAQDKLIVGTYYDGKIMIFDLRKKKFVKVVSFPGESYVYRAAVGKDGRVYAGTYPRAKLGALNLKTYDLETWDSPAPPNMYLHDCNATADGRILCLYTSSEVKTLIFDPATKQFSPAPKYTNSLSYSVLWNGYICWGNNICDGVTLEKVKPLPIPIAVDSGWSILVGLSDASTLYLQQNRNIYRYHNGDKELEIIAANMDSRYISGLRAVNKVGKLIGTFGQDYYVIDSKSKEVMKQPIPGESSGRPMLFIRPDGKGRVYAGPHFGQTICWIDLKTKKYVNPGIVSGRGGEVYDLTFYQDKLYMASYVGGDVIEYDPAQPWNQWEGKNPKLLARVGPEYIRPVPGIVLGSDNKLYSGWMAKYGTYGGAIAITDPATGKTKLIENPVGNQGISGLAVGDGKIFVGTTLAGNGIPPNLTAKPTFGILDMISHKVIYTYEFDTTNSQAVTSIGYDKGTRSVVMSTGKIMRIFELDKMIFRALNPEETPETRSYIDVPGDGFAYYGSGKKLIIFYLATNKVVRKVELPFAITRVAVDIDKTIYIACGPKLYRVK